MGEVIRDRVEQDQSKLSSMELGGGEERRGGTPQVANEGGGAGGRMVMCESVGQGKRAMSWLSGEGEPTPRRMGPEKQSGHEFPHGQTALLVPSNNQKTVS